MAKPQLLLLVALLVSAFACASADDSAAAGPSADGPRPSVLTPISKTPLPADDDVPVEDEDAGGVGSPTGAYMVEPEGSKGKSKNHAAAPSGGAISMCAVAAVVGCFVM